MAATEINDKIIGILSKYVFNKKLILKATPGSRLTKDLKINSARVVDIVLDIEDEFEVEIDNKSLEKIKTISDLTSLVNSLLSAKK